MYQTIKLDNCLEIDKHAIRKKKLTFDFFFPFQFVEFKFSMSNSNEVRFILFSFSGQAIIRTVQVRTNETKSTENISTQFVNFKQYKIL